MNKWLVAGMFFGNSLLGSFGGINNFATGNSAANGFASALQGSATSINQADHQADLFNTRSSALSANTATGLM